MLFFLCFSKKGRCIDIFIWILSDFKLLSLSGNAAKIVFL